MNLKELEARIRAQIKGRYRPWAGALLTYALVPSRTPPAWTLVTGRLVFADVVGSQRNGREYDGLVLGEEWITDPERCADRLASLGSGTGVLSSRAVLGAADQADVSLSDLRRSRDQSLTGWTEDAYRARLTREQPDIPHRPLVRRGLPPFPQFGAAIRDWCWSDGAQPWMRGEIPHLGELVVILPDTRARFANAEWGEEGVVVRLDANVPVSELEVQLPLVVEGRRTLRVVIPEQVTALPEDSSPVEFFLVHEDASLLDQIKLDRPGREYSAVARQLSAKEQAEEDIRGLEDEHVELKPFVEPGHEKEFEIVKSIVAFSNSGGGRLYVGVRDDGTPQTHVDMRKVLPKDPTKLTAEETLSSRLRTIAREKIKPVPSVEIETVEVFGERVFLVRVPGGEDRPYATQENDVYVRKGARNVRPDPRTELPALAPQVDGRKFEWGK